MHARGAKVVAEVEYAYGFVDEPVIGITGTNGKSTTTALVAHLLAEAGRSVFVGGNLGTPLSDRVLEAGKRDVSVVELSSYQLEGIETFRPRVAVVTNLAPDHLDRYPSVEAYWEAKARIFRNQREEDFAVLNGDDPVVLRHHEGPARVFRFSRRERPTEGAFDDGTTLHVFGLPDDAGEEHYRDLSPALRGAHGRQNAMAGILAARLLGADPASVARGLASFPGLPHRLQSVGTFGGAEWIDDSKATNVESAMVALAAFPGPILWIAGGKGKGAPYAPLRPLLSGRVRLLLTIGEDGPRIQSELGDLVPSIACHTVEAAVRRAAEEVRPGEVVLFSPACASFDQFRNFEERGRAFAAHVRALG
jgi:UDP-N-acetylmuramoylalanine--D-glutamate ligase